MPNEELVCDVRSPTTGDCPVVFDSPHSGMDWPRDFSPAASREAILTTWDAWVDELWSGVVEAGATLVAARFPRVYVDVNRSADDIDPVLLDGPWPKPIATSDYSRRGMGLIRRLALPGVPMYERPLRVIEVQRRLEVFYFPYRRILQEQIDRAHEAHGAVWHVNCHSMKSRGNAMNIDAGAVRPDFVVSDRLGTTARPEFTRWVAGWFEAQGHSVQINDPYRGGDLVGTYGRPAENRQSVQIEINRALYLDEATFQRHEKFSDLQQELSAFARALCLYTKEQGFNSSTP